VFALATPHGGRVLKIAADAGGSSVAKEVWLRGLLEKQGLPVARLERADTQGTLFGRAYFITASAGDGTVRDELVDRPATGGTWSSAMGHLLARIHELRFAVPGDLREGGVVPADPGLFFGQLQEAARRLADQDLLDAAAVATFATARLPPSDAARLCHGDFQPVQCIVDGARISAVVDWEAAWAGDPLTDLALAETHLRVVAGARAAEAFLLGYSGRRAIPGAYAEDYRPVRLACLVGLLGTWLSQGAFSVEQARRASRVQALSRLFGSLARGPGG
jgi:aminoglycoside phosphotransferase (APT) family kinase protein